MSGGKIKNLAGWKSAFSLLLWVVVPLLAWATSTPGTRNVNTSDGVVNGGALNGTNGANWEVDEFLAGPAGAAHWFMSWDDTHLHIGRIGGSNGVASMLQVHADYPGATYASRGFLYDQSEPEASALGGVNFTAYFGAGSHEFRTFSSGWSAAFQNLTLPNYSTQGNGDHFEVSIPWTLITAGNGRPRHFRIVMYQVALGAPGCAQELISSESPWGTGNPGDGPNVAVNDGVPTSLLQPGGCDVGDSTLRRWWGCYPTGGGIGPNAWIPAGASAGVDDSICSTATDHFMAATAAPAPGLGTWTVLTQPSGSPAVTFSSANQPNALASNLTGVGVYEFVWTVDYAGCRTFADTMVLTRVGNPAPAVTMGDTVVGCNGNTALLRGSDPAPGVAVWALVSGAGSIASPGSANTLVTGLAPGNNVFSYTVSNGVCPTTTDNVLVISPSTVPSDAGPDQRICEGPTVTLGAADPALVQASATGQWLQVSGPSLAFFNDFTDPNTLASFIIPGTFEFVWYVSNLTCPVSSDTMTLVVDSTIVADAGGDQRLCLGSGAVLAGNDVSGASDMVSYTWSQVSGPSNAVFGDPTQWNAAVGALMEGQYVLEWHVQNGSCPADSDLMTVTIVDLDPNGVASVSLPDSGASNGTIVLAQPVTGNSPYTYSIDGLNFGNSATFAGLPSGNYLFYLMDGNGCWDSLAYTLAYTPPIDTLPPADTIKIPTGFSPNSDGINDFWEIPGIEKFPNAVVEVFNAWGGLVFRSEGNYQPWNGQRNGQDMPLANYYFIIDLKAEGQSIHKGSLTILR